MFTGMNSTQLAKHSYGLIDSAHVRPGDPVLRTVIGGGGHAGIFIGWAAGGHPIGWANNGSPAYPTIMNRDTTTGPFDFKVKSGHVTKFFRPQTP